MHNHIAIRNATTGDWDEIIKILKSANMHHIPSLEVPKIDINETFVAEMDSKIVGMCGITMISNFIAKTTLMAVYPEYKGLKIGSWLQHHRMSYVHKKFNATHLKTLSDRPRVIEWYKKHFGYEETGTLDKIHEFGDPDISKWTILMTDLNKYFRNFGV